MVRVFSTDVVVKVGVAGVVLGVVVDVAAVVLVPDVSVGGGLLLLLIYGVIFTEPVPMPLGRSFCCCCCC